MDDICPNCGYELRDAINQRSDVIGFTTKYCGICKLYFNGFYNNRLEIEYWTYQSTNNRRTSDDMWDYVEPPNTKGRIPGGRFTRDG